MQHKITMDRGKIMYVRNKKIETLEVSKLFMYQYLKIKKKFQNQIDAVNGVINILMHSI